MVRLRQPSSRIVCLSGCVLHQSSRKYRRSVTWSASWLDSSTSSVEVTGPISRETGPLMAGWWHRSDSFGLYLVGCGNALWYMAASELLWSRSPRTAANISTECVFIPEADGERVFYAQLLRAHYAANKRANTRSFRSLVNKRSQQILNWVTWWRVKSLTSRICPLTKSTACASLASPSSSVVDLGMACCTLGNRALAEHVPPPRKTNKKKHWKSFPMQINSLFDFTQQNQHKHVWVRWNSRVL